MQYSSREICFFVLMDAFYKKKHAEDILKRWHKDISEKDRPLIKEIIFGIIRRRWTLEHYLKQLNFNPKRLSQKETLIFFIALYQFLFLEKVPLYAIANEAVEMAKKYGRNKNIALFNAILRNIKKEQFSLPSSDDCSSLSVRYSYPQFLIERYVSQFGLSKAKELLDVQNRFFPPMFRDRFFTKPSLFPVHILHKKKLCVCRFSDKTPISIIERDNRYYIQNFTPAVLIESLSENIQSPSSILDICSSPGGKLLALYDLFSSCHFTANDISKEKIDLLKTNCEKYHIPAHITQQNALYYVSRKTYDLIVLDVPCSNSGVLHKRPEARWRLSEKTINMLVQQQWQMVKHALSLVNPGGQIWYMTCSILHEENESIIQRAINELSLEIVGEPIIILPDNEGKDGGFGCSLRKKN